MDLYKDFEDAELIYKRLYQLLPSVWEKPVENWSELVNKYHGAGIFDIPEESLSPVQMIFTEEDFFAEHNREVVCFNNLRYCPPFIHKLKFFKIIYVYQGNALIFLNGIKHEVNAGGFCIVAPEVIHTVFSRHDEDVVINVLIKESSFVYAFSNILVEQNILTDFFWKILYTKHSNRVLLFQCDGDKKLDRLIERMCMETLRGEDTSNLLMKSYVMIFLGIIMREHLHELKTVEELTDKVYVMPAIIEEMKKNLKTISLLELSRKFDMKEEDIKHYIVRESGYTYNYLLRDLRLRRVAWLLENTNLSIESIMEEVGYYNIANFYSSFKERFGKTPQEYRKNGDILI